MAKKKNNVNYLGTGRRKSSVARVYMTAGTGVITVNGKTKEVQNTLTIGQYLEENSYVPSQIAVELNERILSKAEYSTTVLHENDILEIVSFMGGGR